MQFANFIAAAVGLIAATVAATPVITHSRFTSTAFEVTNLTMTRQPGGLANLTFIVHDGEPAANTTTTCAGSWAYGSSGWPKDGYQACNNAHIQWNMASYDSWTSFTLNVDHIFFDPAIGEQVTTFAKANFNGTTIACTTEGTRESCLQSKGHVLRAPITATSAKRR